MLYQHITELIGDTPLLRIDPAVHQLPCTELYAKLESANPFGSVKDRAVWGMVSGHIGEMRDSGMSFVEASSGNTAKALRVLAAMHGIGLRAFANRVRVPETRDLLMLLGADVQELPGLSECPDPTAPQSVFTAINELLDAEPGKYVHPSQYTNEANVEAHYHGTGQEIFNDLGHVDALIGGLGTTGSTRGTASLLRKHNPDLRAVGVVADTSDFIPGIRTAAEMWDVGLFEPDFYDAIVPVTAGDAIDATLELAQRCGILGGPTSGASYAAAKKYLAERNSPTVAVFVVCDRLEPYLSYFRARRPALFNLTRPAPPSAEQIRDVPETTASDLADSAALIVDIRSAIAYRVGHIPGAINIRDDYLDDMLTSGVPFPPGQRLVIVCATGAVSRRFAAMLTARGRDAASLAGGIVAWRDAGQPLASST